MKPLAIVAALVLAAPTSALAAKAVPLGDVVSPVYETEGDAQAIARRGETCMAQVLKPGLVNAPTIISADLAGGVVIGRNAFEYVDKWMISTIERARSRTRFEAKDGRFRIVQTDVEIFFADREWRQAKAWENKIESDPGRLKLLEISDHIAACVKAPADNW